MRDDCITFRLEAAQCGVFDNINRLVTITHDFYSVLPLVNDHIMRLLLRYVSQNRTELIVIQIKHQTKYNKKYFI